MKTMKTTKTLFCWPGSPPSPPSLSPHRPPAGGKTKINLPQPNGRWMGSNLEVILPMVAAGTTVPAPSSPRFDVRTGVGAFNGNFSFNGNDLYGWNLREHRPPAESDRPSKRSATFIETSGGYGNSTSGNVEAAGVKGILWLQKRDTSIIAEVCPRHLRRGTLQSQSSINFFHINLRINRQSGLFFFS